MKTLLAIAFVIFQSFQSAVVFAQSRPAETGPMDAAGFRIGLEKLGVTGTVLYVAAHPDDENTALLAYFSKGEKYRTVYLSLTRGEGGQNILGSEKGADLGVIRTQELMDARRIDGAEQMFSRAIDFGFSKSSVETLNMWGGDEVIGDIVWAIRSVRPDIIITRFSPTEGGHGNHTASAILTNEAYKRSGDAAWYPEQLRYVKPWKAKKLYYNRLNGFDGGVPGSQPGDSKIDVGAYNPILGLTYTEIAGISRSMHKTQAQGTAQSRGSHPEYFQLIDLDSADASLRTHSDAVAKRKQGRDDDDLFSGIETTWKRYAGAADIEKDLFIAKRNYDPEHPERILPLLMRVSKQLASLAGMKANAGDPLLGRKRSDVTDLIASCIGLHCTAAAPLPEYVPGQKLNISLELIAHAGVPMVLRAIHSTRLHIDTLLNKRMQPDADQIVPLSSAIPASMQPSQPYWLVHTPEALQIPNPVTDGSGPVHDYAQMRPAHRYFYDVPSQLYVGMPENPDSLILTCDLSVTGEPVTVSVPVRYRTVDPIDGERELPPAIVPAVDVAMPEKMIVWTRTGTQRAVVRISSNDSASGGSIRLMFPKGCTASPSAIAFAGMRKNEGRSFGFTIDADSTAVSGTIGAVVESEHRQYDQHSMTISYPHIVPQSVMHAARVKAVRADVRTIRRRIGYVMGSGDEVPEGLRRCGYDCETIDDDSLQAGELGKYESIVLGVRAYNVRKAVRRSNARLLDYARNGGTLIVQYQTPGNEVEGIGPYPFRISRNRVTDENAVMTSPFAQTPSAPAATGQAEADTSRTDLSEAKPDTMAMLIERLMTVPNRLSADDFEGWVQERGLYFADQWDGHFSAPFTCSDPGEPPQHGSLLVARFGKGIYCYTGLSFFRQLPAGIPGAFRLMSNLIELTQ